MKESDLLQYCRYYKGERKNPYEGKEQNKAMLWMYERAWIHDTMAVIARGDANVSESRNLDEYVAVGLSDFENADGVPITLKSLLSIGMHKAICPRWQIASNRSRNFISSITVKGAQ